jgi:hypothetical protein
MAYRRTGADPPFGDPTRAHGVAMEGYYWRLTDSASDRVVVALCGACRGPRGPWAIVALAVHPEGVVRSAITGRSEPDPSRLGLRAGELIEASEDRLRVDLGPGARLDVALHARRPWPRRAFGGLGVAQSAPRLPQYWHPHLLGGAVRGELEIDGHRVSLDGAHAYAEKNWGPTFSRDWWWGQAHDFEGADACVAFAGGRIRPAGVPMAPTAVVVRLGEEVLRLVAPLALTRAAIGRDGWHIQARSARYAVEIEGDGAGSAPAILPVPLPAEHRVFDGSHQVLAGRMVVTVRRGRRTLLRATSELAGLERDIDLG